MANKMLIDASHPEETRVVVLRGNRIEEFDFESASKKPLRGNIYLAKVTRVEPSLQAAFIEYGGNRHGFLAFSEIHPDYYQIPVADRQALLEEEQRQQSEDEDEEARPRRSRRNRRRNGRERRARNDDAVTGEVPVSALGDMGPLANQPADQRSDQTAPEFSPVESADAPANLAQETLSADARADAAASDRPTSEKAEATAPAQAAGADEIRAAETGASAHEQPAQQLAAEPVAVIGASQAALEAGEPAQAMPDEAALARGPGGDDEGQGSGSDRDREDDKNGKENEDEDDDEDEDDEDDDEEDDEDDEDDEDEDEEQQVEHVGGDDAEERPVRASRPRRQYKIQEVIRRRQVLLVQVVKEERGNKGAALTTYLSLAGRYSVLMPNTARGGGISRKITDSDDRKRMKEIVQDLDVPEGMGVILRTAGASRSKQEVRRDFEHLLRMWESVRELTLESTAPTLVYEEGSLIKRSVRDLYSDEIEEITVAGDEGYREARDYMRMLIPSHARKIRHWRETQPLFARMGVEAQLDSMFSAQVILKSGGYIVINQTEALVAIDVNSGRSTREHNIEDTALRTNLEAADEVARQLRLRDLAGLIVVDFIDMEENRNNRAVERRLKEALKNDRARIQVGRISHFGLLEMSRQRMRTGVLEGSSVICPHCSGAGTVRSTASISLHILRAIEDSLVRSAQHNLIVRTRSTVALYMLNQKRAHLREIEERYGVTLTIEVDDSLVGSTYHALERGELAAPAPVPMRQGLVRIDSLAPPVDADEEDEPEALEASDASEGEIEAEAEGENGDEERADADGENGKRRRRRRRRRGRERDASGVDPDAPQPSDEGLAKMARIEGDLPPFGASATDAPGPDLPALDLPRASDGEVDEREAEREGEMAIAREPGETEGDRDGRRRRRTRRPRRERPAQDDHASQSGFRSPYGSWVRSSETGEPEYDARTEPVDLTAFGAAPDQSAQAGPADAPVAAQASPDSPAQASAPEFAETAPQQAAETRQWQQAEPHVERQPEPPAAPASERPAREAEPAPTASAAQAQTPAEPGAQPAAAPEPPPARVVEALPEAPPPTQKRSGWWQRAKAQISGE